MWVCFTSCALTAPSAWTRDIKRLVCVFLFHCLFFNGHVPAWAPWICWCSRTGISCRRRTLPRWWSPPETSGTDCPSVCPHRCQRRCCCRCRCCRLQGRTENKVGYTNRSSHSLLIINGYHLKCVCDFCVCVCVCVRLVFPLAALARGQNKPVQLLPASQATPDPRPWQITPETTRAFITAGPPFRT